LVEACPVLHYARAVGELLLVHALASHARLRARGHGAWLLLLQLLLLLLLQLHQHLLQRLRVAWLLAWQALLATYLLLLLLLLLSCLYQAQHLLHVWLLLLWLLLLQLLRLHHRGLLRSAGSTSLQVCRKEGLQLSGALVDEAHDIEITSSAWHLLLLLLWVNGPCPLALRLLLGLACSRDWPTPVRSTNARACCCCCRCCWRATVARHGCLIHGCALLHEMTRVWMSWRCIVCIDVGLQA
jgi:hypothetical protein